MFNKLRGKQGELKRGPVHTEQKQSDVANDAHISYTWNITEAFKIKQIHSASKGKAFFSEHFEIGGLDFQIKLYPNGNNKPERDGKCMVFLELSSMSNAWKGIHFSWTLGCKQTMACDQRIDIYNADGPRGKGRVLGTFEEIKQFSALTVRITVNVLRVYLKDSDKLYYQFAPKQFKPKQRITWEITGNLLAIVKRSYVGKKYTSDIQGDMWRLQISPNGTNDNSRGKFMVNLLLCAYPVNVNKLILSRTDYCMETKMRKKGQIAYEWDKRPPGGLYFMSFADIQQHETLTIAVDVEIQKAFYMNGEEVDMVLKKFEDYAQNSNYVQNDESKESKENMEQNDMISKQEINQIINDKVSTIVSMYDARLNSMMTNMETMNAKIVKIENKLSDLLCHEEQKNDNDNDDIMKEITALKQQMKQLMVAKSPNNANDSAKERLRLWVVNVVGFSEYYDLFIENGIEDLDTIKEFTQNELKMIGIDKIGHRIKIMKCIRVLMNQQNNNAFQFVAGPQINQYEGNTEYM